MSRSLVFAAGCATLVCASAAAMAQPPGGYDRGERSERGRGSFSSDPNERFNQLSGGKDVIVIDQLDERTKFFVNMMAQRAGITNGQITRDQYKSAMETFRSQMGGGGFRGPGGASGERGGPGGSPTFMRIEGSPTITRFERAGERSPEQVERESDDSFRRHDRDNDGVLRADEMSSTLRTMWEKYDANKDGAVDLKEYKGYFQERMQSRLQESSAQPPQLVQPGQPSPAVPAEGLPPAPTGPAQPEEEDRRPVVFRVGKLPKELPAWFVELDTDKDGQVGLYEWVKGNRAVDEYREMDRNDDGLMTIEEVLGYTRNGNKHPGNDTAVAGTGGEERGRFSRFGSDGRGGPPGGRFGEGRSYEPRFRPWGDSGRGGPPNGEYRGRGDSSEKNGDGYPSRSRYGRGPDRGGSGNGPTDSGRSDAPKDGNDKKDKRERKDKS